MCHSCMFYRRRQMPRRNGGRGPQSEEIRTPLYIQVYERLLREIQEGRFANGAYLPSERDLVADLFGVDRQTVRRSLEIRMDEGTVEKQPGLGSIAVDRAESRLTRRIPCRALAAHAKHQRHQESVLDTGAAHGENQALRNAHGHACDGGPCS